MQRHNVKQSVTLYMPRVLHFRAKAAAARKEMSLSGYVCGLIEKGLKAKTNRKRRNPRG